MSDQPNEEATKRAELCKLAINGVLDQFRCQPVPYIRYSETGDAIVECGVAPLADEEEETARVNDEPTPAPLEAHAKLGDPDE